ncbi:metal ABC transporter ATP-binding protein [Alphaproteobacteria bacterium]|nr:metal ABC transporter ATP-binding protein [Alphaproteobacteria bacterium]
MAEVLMTLISIKNLTVTLNGQHILHNVTCSFAAGTLTTVIGPNGSGKTTLIKALLGEVPYQGHINFVPGCTIGYVPQNLEINRAMPLRVKDFLDGFGGGKPAYNTNQVIEAFGLQKIVHASFHSLSGGERQRTLMARALMGDPQILILDEAMAGLDLTGESQIIDFISFWVKKLKRAAVMISHDLHYVLEASDQVICLNGHVCCSGHPDHVKGHKDVQNLLEPGRAPYTHNHNHSHGSRLNGMQYDHLLTASQHA